MNPLVPSTHSVRIVADLSGLRDLLDPYGDLARLFLLDYHKHEKITEHWVSNFFNKSGTFGIICKDRRIVAKALLQCDIYKNGKVFGHIGHFTTCDDFLGWQMALLHALIGYAKGTVSDLMIARNKKCNRYTIQSDFRLRPSVTTTAAT